jgi:predicted MFS family arabinose efflux permease
VSRRLILLLALTCGVAVGNIYFPQAISPLVASGLHVTPDSATLVVTATQFGYAAGIFLLVPLGDRLPHRPLIVTLLGLTGLGLLAASASPALPPLVGASALIGVTTVVAPIIGPMAAGLVAEDRHGVVSGTLLSGSIGGMLLSRAFGGSIGEWLGWRAPYLMAAAFVLLIAIVVARALPSTTPPSGQRYPALLAESLRLLRTEPQLRRSCLYQATVFAGFSAVWTGVALLLTSPTYAMGTQAVGLLALVNAATMLCTPIAGRQVDRRGPDAVNLVCMLGVIASAVVLAFGSLGGALGLTALALGSLLLDVGMQSGMVANQVRIYALRPEARSRLNTAYMTCAYLGGSFGSWLGARTYIQFGWLGVCALAASLTGVALARHLTSIPVTDASRRGQAGTQVLGCSVGDRADCTLLNRASRSCPSSLALRVDSEQLPKGPLAVRCDFQRPAGPDPLHQVQAESPPAQRRADRASQVHPAFRPVQTAPDHRPGPIPGGRVDAKLGEPGHARLGDGEPHVVGDEASVHDCVGDGHAQVSCEVVIAGPRSRFGA